MDKPFSSKLLKSRSMNLQEERIAEKQAELLKIYAEIQALKTN
jgi:hypothetical protein